MSSLFTHKETADTCAARELYTRHERTSAQPRPLKDPLSVYRLSLTQAASARKVHHAISLISHARSVARSGRPHTAARLAPSRTRSPPSPPLPGSWPGEHRLAQARHAHSLHAIADETTTRTTTTHALTHTHPITLNRIAARRYSPRRRRRAEHGHASWPFNMHALSATTSRLAPGMG